MRRRAVDRAHSRLNSITSAPSPRSNIATPFSRRRTAACTEVTQTLCVVGFCAAWCNTCDAFRNDFDELAAARPQADFVWIDIEDDAELAGDIDIENFPTVAIFVGRRLVHFGVTLPQRGVIARLIDSFDDASPTIEGIDALQTLIERLPKRH